MHEPTPNQRRAVESSGNVLVVAGAGAGKTRTLVQRCLAFLLDGNQRGSIDQILMVTFTEAAAAEMRKRIRETLEEKLQSTPDDSHLAEQIALLDGARICTLHSFCLQIVREHFYTLGLDPQISVLPDERSRLLASDVLDGLMKEIYEGKSPVAESVQRLVTDQGRGWDKPICDLVKRVHAYTQTLRDPAGWFATRLEEFTSNEPLQWRQWLREEWGAWAGWWLPVLHAQEPENVVAQRCARALLKLNSESDAADAAAVFQEILAADNEWPPRKKGILREPVKKIFAEAEFFNSLCASKNEEDPLAQDWSWVKPQVNALLQLAQQFTQQFSKAKRDKGVLDFHDLEQFALELLWDKKQQRPTVAAEQWQKQFELVLVDEYQDINAAQDEILKCLARPGEQANRFLVGDVKQSIYRFRLANPRIFLDHEHRWKTAPVSQVISLSDNFRSHEAILNFVNPLFAALMKERVGGVAYGDSATLGFGNRAGRSHMTVAADPELRVELHLQVAGNTEGDSEIDSSLDTLSDTEKEARLVARRLLELKTACYPVWKDGTQQPAQWSDMVILLRSPRNKAEAFAKIFSKMDIPLTTARGGFYETIEVTDVLNLLKLLDNPLQDLPLLAVLRSPFVGLSLDELATIRMAQRNAPFWTALRRCHEVNADLNASLDSEKNSVSAKDPALFAKIDELLNRFKRWRRLKQQMSLSQLVETILDETHYTDWLLAQNQGEPRRANVERLLEMTRQFDSLQGQGLFPFLSLVEAQKDAEIDLEPAGADVSNAVRLMSIHQSKGLEFPIVVVADLGKPFNFSDTKEKAILDEIYGICPQVMPPGTRQTYPSLPYWMAQRRQKIETLGEELRLLYVATTRAVDRLILTGTTSSKACGEKWPALAARGLDVQEIADARNYLDWIGPWLASSNANLLDTGENSLLRWMIYNDGDPRLSLETNPVPETISPAEDPLPAEALEQLQARIRWSYEYPSATVEPAKTSVSALRRRAQEADDVALQPFRFRPKKSGATKVGENSAVTAAEIGTAHHTFLELVSLDRVSNANALRAEAERIQQSGLLSAEEVGALDLSAIAAFWNSDVGQKIVAQAACLQREHPFTARLNGNDLGRFGLSGDRKNFGDEFIVLQGVIDLAVILPDEIWVLDFKTDQINEAEIGERANYYRQQVALYADAMEKIYRRPVTRRWLHFLARQKTLEIDAG